MYIGAPQRRKEDYRFLTGRGTFVDDIALPDVAHAAFVRSPHAHARIESISSAHAAAMAGVCAVLTAQDWEAAGNGELPALHPIDFSDGRPMNTVTRPALAKHKVCHVGDAVAVVVAATRDQALDAAEAVEVRYAPLPAVVDLDKALDPQAPIVHEQFGTNLQYERVIGDQTAVQDAFAQAAHATELALTANRLAASPLEARAYMGHYDAARDQYTLWSTAQAPHYVRTWLALNTLNIPEQKIRVIAPDVGGGFGVKLDHYPEEAVVLWAAKVTGRPVRWSATRSESFLADAQARDHLTTCRMAFAENGEILALWVDTLAAAGAYECTVAASIPGLAYMAPLMGLYRNQTVYLRVRTVYTNTVPIEAYRGAGLGEASSVFERLIENGAREMGIDVCEMRARNFIQNDQFPYQSPTGAIYDSGNYPGLLDKVKKLAGYDSLRSEQAGLREQGLLVGIGLSGFPEMAGGAMSSRRVARVGSKFGTWEVATIRVHPSGKITLLAGTHSHGQSHATTYAQIAADALLCDIDDIDVVEGDTDRIPFGNGTWGDRCTIVAGSAITIAAGRVVEKGRRLAAHLLECDCSDVAYESGRFVVGGTDRSLAFEEVAFQAYYGANYPEEGFELGLEETAFWDPPTKPSPSAPTSAAMHLVVVLIDPETGRVTIRDYFAVDDVGRAINPMVLDGQVEGGIAQGLGETLMEKVHFDPRTGQLLSGSFMDYGVPRADDFPRPELDRQETLAPGNPLGVKAGGESGVRGAPAAVANAVVDALWHLGVRHVERPLTPATVWETIRAATSQSAA